ncbi:hypothetical protein K1719_021425 [Acacia pycnantha]|nr:hypothetical protein K1719_021425 [Acacia pycnantha]
MCGSKMVSLMRRLWRKVKKEKKRLFMRSSPGVHIVQYNIDSYSQNFDDGYSSDPDNASRTFSARFAIPYYYYNKLRENNKGCEVSSSDDDNSSEMSS